MMPFYPCGSKKWLTNKNAGAIITAKEQKRKAMTEKSSLPGSIQRERCMVEAAYVEGLRKPFPSRGAEEILGKRRRVPALRVRI